MEFVLLVALAILWFGAGVYWLRTRVGTSSMMLGSPLGRMRIRKTPRAVVVPIHQPFTSWDHAYHQPGHSLVEPPLDTIKKGSNPMEVSSEQARLRRRKVLLSLIGIVMFTLLMAIVVGGAFIAMNLFVDSIFLGYVLLLVQYQREIEASRQQKQVFKPAGVDFAATGADSIAL